MLRTYNLENVSARSYGNSLVAMALGFLFNTYRQVKQSPVFTTGLFVKIQSKSVMQYSKAQNVILPVFMAITLGMTAKDKPDQLPNVLMFYTPYIVRMLENTPKKK